MNCNGCATARDIKRFLDINECVIKHNAPKRACPCEICLVKTTCQTRCESFNNLFKSIFKCPPSYDYKCISSDNLVYNNKYRPFYKSTFNI